MKKIATIAGSDTSGGAGLQADLKTFEEYGLYGMSVVTLIATMDPHNNWSHAVFPLEEEILRSQMETIFSGIGIDALKTGMLGTSYAVEIVREYLTKYKIENYVLDPVMVCKGSGEALNPELNAQIIKDLLPLAKIVTPNLFEAGQIAGIKIKNLADMETAAKIIHQKGAKNIFIKGGAKLTENNKKAIDVFYDGKEMVQIVDNLIETKWTHGAGCTVAAAIASALAYDYTLLDAVKSAKRFITKSLSNSFALNKWVGPGNPSSWREKSFR
ncbi:MAG: bifunctional hydroxymethylpyrimidine kinase/phosphomethylpyrimidine kinase [Treponemataceae bacterium]